MASSQVEIVSSSPFGCVLKDRNRRDQCRDSNAKAAAFQKNLQELVRDHFQNCISVSADENSESIDSKVGKDQGKHNRKLQFLSNNHKKVNANRRFNDDSSILSSKQSRNLDRWAARQAREMVSNIEKHSQEAESLPSSSSSSLSTTTSSSKRENQKNSPAESVGSPEIGNLGASSLVQIWEARLNRSYSMNNDLNPESTSSRTSSGMSNTENIEELPRESEMGGDYVDERYETRANHEEPFQDWVAQSDRIAQREPPTLSQGRNSEDGDSERVRISDIIKKLTSASDDSDHEPVVNVCQSPSRERRNSPETDHAEQREQREQRSLAQLISSPKIRGRQAFADLLMLLERQRQKELDSLAERQAVSKFSHRGRIQSTLRIRCLQRGMAIQDQKRPQSARSPVKLSQGSAIMHLREKFSTGVDHGVTSQNDASSSRSPHTEMANNTLHIQNFSTANRLGEDGNQEAVNAKRISKAPPENSVPQTFADHQKESSPRTDVRQHGTKRETTFLEPQGTSETTTLLNGWGRRSGIAQDQEANHLQHSYSNLQGNSESGPSSNRCNDNETDEQQDTDDQQQLYLDLQETAETTASLNNWEENEQVEEEEDETNEQGHYLETNYDWISEIARPRSYWEDRRETWYQEMLSSSSENEEIRQLLERRRVSTFLASDFRETMDQLMTSRVQRQTELGNYPEEEQEELDQETIRQFLLSHFQRHVQATVSQEEEQAEGGQAEQLDEQIVEGRQEQEEEEDEEYEEQEEDEEGESPISDQFRESSDYFGQSSPSVQTASPSMIRTWSYRDHEVTDDCDPVVSTSSPQPLPSQGYYQDSRQLSSSTNRIYIETELIYDLRAQIEQLHREMSELRKSVQSCVDMQVKMQPSNQPEVHRVREMGNNSFDGAVSKRSCCICYEMQVDSLLYRCGHMCTCLKCAHELQWNSGTCPICRAPITDVVRAFMDS